MITSCFEFCRLIWVYNVGLPHLYVNIKILEVRAVVKTSAVQCKRYSQAPGVPVTVGCYRHCCVGTFTEVKVALLSPGSSNCTALFMFTLSTSRHRSKTCFFSILPLFEKLNIMLNLKGTVLNMPFLCVAKRMLL